MVPLAKADCLLIREPFAPPTKAGSRCTIMRFEALDILLVSAARNERAKKPGTEVPGLILSPQKPTTFNTLP